MRFRKLVGGEDPGRNRPLLHLAQNDFKHFGATHDSTDDSRLKFGIGTALWTKTVKETKGVPWYTVGGDGGWEVYDRLRRG